MDLVPRRALQKLLKTQCARVTVVCHIFYSIPSTPHYQTSGSWYQNRYLRPVEVTLLCVFSHFNDNSRLFSSSAITCRAKPSMLPPSAESRGSNTWLFSLHRASIRSCRYDTNTNFDVKVISIRSACHAVCAPLKLHHLLYSELPLCSVVATLIILRDLGFPPSRFDFPLSLDDTSG